MKYTITHNARFDFTGQSYADCYPNLHPYPATMLPQIGIEILRELGLTYGTMLDPYCGSGSSFAAALEFDFDAFAGCDLNPLALLICRTKFTPVSMLLIRKWQDYFNTLLFLNAMIDYDEPHITNGSYWFEPEIFKQLAQLKAEIDQIDDLNVRQLFYVPLGETIRHCSYTRNNEFKLYRIADITHFSVNVLSVFLKTLARVIKDYSNYYLPKLGSHKIQFTDNFTSLSHQTYDTVLTSPPYGDSKTTVAYGQFSMFANEWLGMSAARQLDNRLMGGRTKHALYSEGVIQPAIAAIYRKSEKRALEVSSFYFDLAHSIREVAQCVKRNGTAIYVVGNRTVKQVELPTDQFIAEQFEQHGFRHLLTYVRRLSNKVMPARNSPTNRSGETVKTMSHEYIVVCENR